MMILWRNHRQGAITATFWMSSSSGYTGQAKLMMWAWEKFWIYYSYSTTCASAYYPWIGAVSHSDTHNLCRIAIHMLINGVFMGHPQWLSIIMLSGRNRTHPHRRRRPLNRWLGWVAWMAEAGGGLLWQWNESFLLKLDCPCVELSCSLWTQ